MIGGLIAALVLSSAAAASAQDRDAAVEPISYEIVAAIDPAARAIQGRERIRWRNTSSAAVNELRLHLLYNALPAASIAVTSVRDGVSGADLLPRATDAVDRAPVLAVPLARTVEPGASVSLDLRWSATPPSDATSDDLVLAAHWYPQVAVHGEGGWVVHQDAARAYTFADAAAYDVTIDVPGGWNVAATGHEEHSGEGARSRRFVLSPASDFAFAVGRSWIERRARVEVGSRPPVDVRLLIRPEHAGHLDRIEAGVRTALQRAEVAAAPFPYRDLAVVDLPWRSRSSREAYPGLVAIAVPWLEPARVTELEAALAGALARHCWQTVVIADLTTHRWMVDGLTMYSGGRLLAHLVQRQLDSTNPDGFFVVRYFGGFVPYAVRAIRTAARGGELPEIRRSALAIETLERYVGWPAFEAMLAGYAGAYAQHHPAPDDFVRVAETASGRDLRWFFDEALGSTRVFDYALPRVVSDAAAGSHRTQVTVARAGDAVFSGSSRPPIGPFQSGRAIAITTTFADGTRADETWDGRAPSFTFVYESAAAARSVVVDPDGILALDVRRTNNSWTAAPAGPATATRWSAVWLAWLENALLTWASLV